MSFFFDLAPLKTLLLGLLPRSLMWVILILIYSSCYFVNFVWVLLLIVILISFDLTLSFWLNPKQILMYFGFNPMRLDFDILYNS